MVEKPEPQTQSDKTLPELSMIALRRPYEALGGTVVPAGARGTIVHRYRTVAVYEVEFGDPIHCILPVSHEDAQPCPTN